jgi:hypothetical protein
VSCQLELLGIEIPGEILLDVVCNLVIATLDALDEPDVDELREASVDSTF